MGAPWTRASDWWERSDARGSHSDEPIDSQQAVSGLSRELFSWGQSEFFQQAESCGIEFAGRIFPQGVEEFVILGRGVGEQRHTGPEFQIIGRTKDFRERTAVNAVYQLGALSKSGTENGVQQVGLGFVQRRNCEPVCSRAAAQTFDLGEDVPHPMGSLAAGAQFGAYVFVVFLLSFQEAL